MNDRPQPLMAHFYSMWRLIGDFTPYTAQSFNRKFNDTM